MHSGVCQKMIGCNLFGADELIHSKSQVRSSKHESVVLQVNPLCTKLTLLLCVAVCLCFLLGFLDATRQIRGMATKHGSLTLVVAA